MEHNEFLKLGFKNRTCCYFDEIGKLEDFDLDNILIEEKSHESILIYDTSIYKTLILPKPLRTRLDKVDGIVRTYDGTRYLTLFRSEKEHDAIYDRIRYLINIKCGK